LPDNAILDPQKPDKAMLHDFLATGNVMIVRYADDIVRGSTKRTVPNGSGQLCNAG
jgi:hypothetical protein